MSGNEEDVVRRASIKRRAYGDCAGDGSLQNFEGASDCSINIKRSATLGRVDLHGCGWLSGRKASCNGRYTGKICCWLYTAVRTSMNQLNPRTGVWGVGCYTPRARKSAELRSGAPWRVVLVRLIDVGKK